MVLFTTAEMCDHIIHTHNECTFLSVSVAQESLHLSGGTIFYAVREIPQHNTRCTIWHEYNVAPIHVKLECNYLTKAYALMY